MISGALVVDFVESAAFFLGTIVAFLFLKDKRQRWLDICFLGAFVFHWIVTLVSDKSLEAKLLATLFMISVAVIRFLVTRKRKQIRQGSRTDH